MEDIKNTGNPNIPEKTEKDGRNLEEMGPDQFDYGVGGPGAGRDDSSTRSNEEPIDEKGSSEESVKGE